MSETLPHHPFIEGKDKQNLKTEMISIAKDLTQRVEGLSFSGVDEKTREKLKVVDAEYPGYTTPVDEIIARMRGEGIKIVLGEDPESGNVFVLPLSSEDVRRDSLLPRHLDTIPEMDASLRTLILAQKTLFKSEQTKD